MKLEIFDVDGTLLKSPSYRANYWRENDHRIYSKIKDHWWTSRLSLGDPYIPCPSPSSFHVDSIVQRARLSQENPDTIFVVMTGRKDHLRDLVERHVVEGMGLEPDYLFLKDKGNTLSFKTKKIDELVKDFEIKKVEIWDDKDPHIPKFEEFLKNHTMISKFKVNHIKENYFTFLDIDKEIELVNRIVDEKDLKHHLRHHAK